jgi:hypothetical protein
LIYTIALFSCLDFIYMQVGQFPGQLKDPGQVKI